jgi:hypothetical protein
VVDEAQRVSEGIKKMLTQLAPEQTGAQTLVSVWQTSVDSILALFVQSEVVEQLGSHSVSPVTNEV